MKVAVVDRLSESQTDDLVALYQKEWWSKGRTLAEVKRMLEGCDIVIGLTDEDSGRLVGFARVISDGVYRASIYDVIVAEELRGQDLGRRLMDTLISHPRLTEVQSVELFCLPEMKPFYEKWGFAPNNSGTTPMRIRRGHAPIARAAEAHEVSQ
jgi:ribosomal protein S18 acetylase RimI-like enzyme